MQTATAGGGGDVRPSLAYYSLSTTSQLFFLYLLLLIGAGPVSIIVFSSSIQCQSVSAGTGRQLTTAQYWVQQNFFNVTCSADGQIQVVNCVTENGTQIPLDSEREEAGIKYSCKMDGNKERGEGADKANLLEEDPAAGAQHVPECDFLPASGRGEYVRGGFAVSCLDNHILGCVDAHGDLAKSGQLYMLSGNRLRRCVVYGRGRWAKSERKGCFNGTREDDPADRRFHVPEKRTWRSGDYELRCGEEGLQVYKCLVEGHRIHVGTGWFDRENVFNVCQ